MKKTRLFTFLIASIFALAISAQGIVVHQGNSKKVSFKSTDVQNIEFTEDQVENSTDNYVEKSELEDLLGKLRDAVNLKLDCTEADKIWKEIERILGLYSVLDNNMVDKNAHESLRNDLEYKKANRSDLDKALKKIDELSNLVKELQSKIGAGGGSGDNTGGSAENNMNNGHEYVDLGLPSGLKWATCNVGADNPEDYGYYYAWGETEPKEVYNWNTYFDSNDEKYERDKKTVLDPEDDVAHVKWGGNWRMPTRAEQDELRTKCTWTWGRRNGVEGYTVVGPNGNSLFLPAAGCRDDSDLSNVGSYGYYWSSSLNSSNSLGAYYLGFGSGYVDWGSNYRGYGRTVRPVCP